MSFYLIMYLVYGVLVFIFEMANGSGLKFSTFIAISYPITISLGAIGWIGFGIYKLFIRITKVRS